MAVTKRLRYEILRRDNHTCRYCGASAPDVALTVDHVTPTALGGSDEPANLVAACKDCNAGKTSSSPDAPLVDDVKADALRWARATEIVISARLQDRAKRDEYVAKVDAAWSEWTYSATEYLPEASAEDRTRWVLAVGDEVAKKTALHAVDENGLAIVGAGGTVKWMKHIESNEASIVAALKEAGSEITGLTVHRWGSRPTRKVRHPFPRPTDWQASIWRFYGLAFPIEDLLDAVLIACGRANVSVDMAWRYMCGVCWRQLEQIQEAAAEVVVTVDESSGEN